jgi:SH3-like domain-containing protein
MIRPKFIDSPYFVPEFDNWHLKPGAPEEVVKEFDEWMKIHEKLQTIGKKVKEA